MTQPAKAREPSMEEILASIRRIIADDDAAKTPPAAAEPAQPAAKAPAPAAKPAPASAAPSPATTPSAPASAAVNSQDDIDALFATLDAVPAAEPAPPEPPPPPPPRPPAPAAARPPADILELTEAMRTPAPPPAFRKVDARSDVVFNEEPEEPESEPEPEPEPEPPAYEAPAARETHRPRARERAPERPLGYAAERPQLLSSSTKTAVDSAFNALAQTVLVQNARTLEDLVREMLRPMLKSWLDDNLPQMVERLVRAEIERVSRGRN